MSMMFVLLEVENWRRVTGPVDWKMDFLLDLLVEIHIVGMESLDVDRSLQLQ